MMSKQHDPQAIMATNGSRDKTTAELIPKQLAGATTCWYSNHSNAIKCPARMPIAFLVLPTPLCSGCAFEQGVSQPGTGPKTWTF